MIEDDSEQCEMSEEEALVIWHKLKNAIHWLLMSFRRLREHLTGTGKEIRVSDVLGETTREMNAVQSEGPSVKKSYKRSKADHVEKFQSKVLFNTKQMRGSDQEMQRSQFNSKKNNSILKLCDSQPYYAKCVNKDEYQTGEDSMSWFYSHSVISERGDTHNKSIESNSFYSDCASSSSNGCAVKTNDLIIREETEIDWFLQISLDRVLRQLRKGSKGQMIRYSVVKYILHNGFNLLKSSLNLLGMKMLVKVFDIGRYKEYGNRLKHNIGVISKNIRRLLRWYSTWQRELINSVKWAVQMYFLLLLLLYISTKIILTMIMEDLLHNYNSDASSIIQNMIEDVVIIVKILLQLSQTILYKFRMIVYKLGFLLMWWYDLRWQILMEMMLVTVRIMCMSTSWEDATQYNDYCWLRKVRMNRNKEPQMWAPQPNWTFNGNIVYCRLPSISSTDDENTTNYNIPNIRDRWKGVNYRRA